MCVDKKDLSQTNIFFVQWNFHFKKDVPWTNSFYLRSKSFCLFKFPVVKEIHILLICEDTKWLIRKNSIQGKKLHSISKFGKSICFCQNDIPSSFYVTSFKTFRTLTNEFGKRLSFEGNYVSRATIYNQSTVSIWYW